MKILIHSLITHQDKGKRQGYRSVLRVWLEATMTVTPLRSKGVVNGSPRKKSTVKAKKYIKKRKRSEYKALPYLVIGKWRRSLTAVGSTRKWSMRGKLIFWRSKNVVETLCALWRSKSGQGSLECTNLFTQGWWDPSLQLLWWIATTSYWRPPWKNRVSDLITTFC